MDCALTLIAGGRPVKRVCEVLGVARSNVAEKLTRPADWQDGRGAGQTDDAGLVEEIRNAVAHLPSYGYRRVWGVLRRERERHSAPPVNVKRVFYGGEVVKPLQYWISVAGISGARYSSSLQAINFRSRTDAARSRRSGCSMARATARTTFYPCRRRAGHHIPHAQSAGTAPVTCAPHLKRRLPGRGSPTRLRAR